MGLCKKAKRPPGHCAPHRDRSRAAVQATRAEMSGEGESGPGAPAASGAAAGGADKSHLFVFSAAKAGMQGVDREHVNQVVYEMSRGSRFMANQERLDQRLQERLAGFRARMDSLQGRDLSAAARRVDAQAAEVEAAERVLDRTWAVVDMDMFFAAVELRDRPHLRGRPMAVGGTSMLSTTNYEARKYGVRSAMPGFIARRLCPDLVLVPPDGAKYKAAAAQARAVFAQYDPDLASASLDEAYLDLTGFLARRGHEARYHAACRAQPCPVSGPQAGEFNPGRAHAAGCAAVEAVVAEMRREVFARTQLTCSAGIAPNAMLAKIASDRNKPDGQFCVPPTREGVLAFARALPVRRVPGIGRVTERLLRELGVTTVQHLHDQRALLALLFSPRAAQWFVRLSLGIARAHHKPPPPGPGRKSISTERTFRAESDPGRLYTLCQGLCASLARDMAAKGLRARTLTVKLKRADFHVIQVRASHAARAVPSPLPHVCARGISRVARRAALVHASRAHRPRGDHRKAGVGHSAAAHPHHSPPPRRSHARLPGAWPARAGAHGGSGPWLRRGEYWVHFPATSRLPHVRRTIPWLPSKASQHSRASWQRGAARKASARPPGRGVRLRGRLMGAVLHRLSRRQ